MSGSSGDEGVLQIDVSEPAVKPKAKGGRKEKTTWKTGDVVWAKVSGFNYWPAKVGVGGVMGRSTALYNHG